MKVQAASTATAATVRSGYWRHFVSVDVEYLGRLGLHPKRYFHGLDVRVQLGLMIDL